MNLTDSDPDVVVAEFRQAVGQDCMGHFCERYGLGKFEWLAASPMHLIQLVAEHLHRLYFEKAIP